MLNYCFAFGLVQLTTTEDQSLNGYMVAPREDTGTPLAADVAYVGSWEMGAGMKLICGGVSMINASIRLNGYTAACCTYSLI